MGEYEDKILEVIRSKEELEIGLKIIKKGFESNIRNMRWMQGLIESTDKLLWELKDMKKEMIKQIDKDNREIIKIIK